MPVGSRVYTPTAGKTTTFFRPRKKQILSSGGFPTALTRCTTTQARLLGIKGRTDADIRTIAGMDHWTPREDASALHINGIFVWRLLHTGYKPRYQRGSVIEEIYSTVNVAFGEREYVLWVCPFSDICLALVRNSD